MSVQITHTVSMTLTNRTPLAELELFIDAVKSSGIANPTLTITHYAGDQREPSQTTLTASTGRR